MVSDLSQFEKFRGFPARCHATTRPTAHSMRHPSGRTEKRIPDSLALVHWWQVLQDFPLQTSAGRPSMGVNTGLPASNFSIDRPRISTVPRFSLPANVTLQPRPRPPQPRPAQPRPARARRIQPTGLRMLVRDQRMTRPWSGSAFHGNKNIRKRVRASLGAAISDSVQT